MAEVKKIIDPENVVIDLDKALGKAKEGVRLVGIEVEGGWLKLPKGSSSPHQDSSIRLPTQVDPTTGKAKTMTVGEYNSDPMSPDKFHIWLENFYPQIVNETCGLHVHMSFKTALQYQRLMTPKFRATMIDYLTRWATKEKFNSSHPIWPRLQGRNEYCQPAFYADVQVTKQSKDFNRRNDGNRYTQISYPWYNSTVECRVLPMMDKVDQAIRAVQMVVDVTNAFLVCDKEKEQRFEATIKVDHENDVHDESITIEVPRVSNTETISSRV